MNQNVHFTTLERMGDYIMNICITLSQEQKLEKQKAKKTTLNEVSPKKIKIK